MDILKKISAFIINLRSNISFKILSSSIIGVLIILFSLSVFFFHQQKVALTNELIKQILDIGNTYVLPCSTSLKNSNDLQLLSYINEMTQKPGISSVMVLDMEGKAIAHNQINRWGKIYKDKWAKEALQLKSNVIRKFKENNKEKLHLYFPIYHANQTIAILKIETTTLDISKKLKKLIKNIYILICTCILLFSLWLTWIIKHIITIPLNNLKSDIESLDLSKTYFLDIKKSTTFKEIEEKINTALTRLKEEKIAAENQTYTQQKQFDIFLKNIGEIITTGILLVDSSNKIIFINDIASQILKIKKEDILHNHILDIIKNAKILSILNDSQNNLNKITTGTFQINESNYIIKIITLSDEANKFLGRAVFFQV